MAPKGSMHVFPKKQREKIQSRDWLSFSVYSCKSRGVWLRNWFISPWFCPVRSLHKPQLQKKRGTCREQTVKVLSLNENLSDSFLDNIAIIKWYGTVDNTKMLWKFLWFNPFLLSQLLPNGACHSDIWISVIRNPDIMTCYTVGGHKSVLVVIFDLQIMAVERAALFSKLKFKSNLIIGTVISACWVKTVGITLSVSSWGDCPQPLPWQEPH